MAITKVTRTLLSTGIVDNSNATAITIDSSENLIMTAGGTIRAGGANDLILDAGESGTPDIYLQSGGSTKVKIEGSNGNVGIGTTSPSSKLQIMGGTSGVDQISLSSNLSDNTAKDAGIIMTMYTNNTAALIGGLAVNGNTSLVYGSSGTDHRGVTKHIWYTNTNYNSTSGNTERMRMDSAGSLLVGTSSKASACSITAPASPTVPAFLTANTTSGATHYAAFFRNSGGTEIGFIKISNTGTTYDTGSDYRLKENAQPIQNGLERLNQLNPVKFDWKEDGTSSEGFIAHEVQEIFPDAVSGEKDAETMQGMDYGRITPLLVKAIQEQQTQIDALQSEINLLKGE